MPAATVARLTAANLPHTCTIETRAQSAPSGVPAFDDYGEATLTTYAPGATGVLCFCRRRTGPGETDEPGRALVAESWQVRLPRGQAIGPDDLIGDVRDAAGGVIVAGPLAISDLLIRAGHVLAICQAATLAGPTTVEDDE